MMIPTPARPAFLALLLAVPGCVHVNRRGPEPKWRERVVTGSLELPAGCPVAVANVAGRILLQRAPGRTLEVRAVVHAGGRSLAEAGALSDKIGLRLEQTSDGATVRVDYPFDDHELFYYPEWAVAADGRGDGCHKRGLKSMCKMVARFDDGTKATVISRPARSALPLYADLLILVPAGSPVNIENLVGLVAADGVEGALSGEVLSGALRITRQIGALEMETGSGDILIDDQRGGAVKIESGSGDIRLSRVTAPLSAASGSGDIAIDGVGEGEVEVESGSGDLNLSGIRGVLRADSGTGHVVVARIISGNRLSLETGTGDILLDGDFAAIREASVQSGSGDVRVSLRGAPPLTLKLSTGSGELAIDLDQLSGVRSDAHEYSALYRGGGSPFTLETGSGDIEVNARELPAPPALPAPPPLPALPGLTAPVPPTPPAPPAPPVPSATAGRRAASVPSAPAN